MNTNFLLKIPILLKINVMVFFPLHKGMWFESKAQFFADNFFLRKI
jgi:hypothetical protein